MTSVTLTKERIVKQPSISEGASSVPLPTLNGNDTGEIELTRPPNNINDNDNDNDSVLTAAEPPTSNKWLIDQATDLEKPDVWQRILYEMMINDKLVVPGFSMSPYKKTLEKFTDSGQNVVKSDTFDLLRKKCYKALESYKDPSNDVAEFDNKNTYTFPVKGLTNSTPNAAAAAADGIVSASFNDINQVEYTYSMDISDATDFDDGVKFAVRAMLNYALCGEHVKVECDKCNPEISDLFKYLSELTEKTSNILGAEGTPDDIRNYLSKNLSIISDSMNNSTLKTPFGEVVDDFKAEKEISENHLGGCAAYLDRFIENESDLLGGEVVCKNPKVKDEIRDFLAENNRLPITAKYALENMTDHQLKDKKLVTQNPGTLNYMIGYIYNIDHLKEPNVEEYFSTDNVEGKNIEINSSLGNSL